MEDQRPQALLSSGYLVAAVVALPTLFDLVLRLRPFRPGDVSWRIGAVGTVSIQFGILLLALFVACLTAHHLGHRGLLRQCAQAE